MEFDFPEKPKPVESNVPCPKCQKLMKKGQWQYECECGFRLWHTIAKVELSEEIIIELLTTGKTKQKVTGFTSKAGNVFDTCLKYEDEQIKFDFDNTGERSFVDEVEMEEKALQNADGQSGKGILNQYTKSLEENLNESTRLQEEAKESVDATDDEFMYLQQMAEYVEEENLMVDEELLALAHEMER